MYGVVYFFTRLLVLFFSFVSVALLVRAILSWFVREGDSPFSSLLILITEPLIRLSVTCATGSAGSRGFRWMCRFC